MTWNPFRRRDDEQADDAAQPQAAVPEAAANGDDDPTDPLIEARAFTEDAETLREWPGLKLELVRFGSGGQSTDSFLRLAVAEEGALSRSLPGLLTGGGALFGLRDLLADNRHALAASLDPAGQGFEDLLGQAAMLRPLDVLMALHDLAAGLEMAQGHGLGWKASRDALAFEHRPGQKPGLDRWQLRFLGFGELAEGLATEATELVTLFRPLLDAVLTTQRPLLPAGSHIGPLYQLLEKLQADEEIDLSSLRKRLAAFIGGTTFSGIGLTDSGMRRQHNEDAWLLAEIRQQAAIGSHFMLAAVADGMGGHESGEVASSLALSMLRQQLQAALTAPSTRPVEHAALTRQLEALIPGINRALCDRSAMEPSMAGMGTTLCGFAIVAADSTLHEESGLSAALFNVGDSRCYLVTPGRLKRLTTDHSFVQDLVENGDVSEEEAFDHPRKNVITRCLGGDGMDIEADVSPFIPGPGERIIICSDGLSDALRDAEIADVLAANTGSGPADTAKALVDAANAAGGPDNITVLLLDCLPGTPQ